MRKIPAWKSVVFAFAFALSGILVWNQSGFGGPNQKGQSIVVHLSHSTDDLHRATMALDLARALQEAGASVTLFMDLEGVRLVDKSLPQDLAWGFGAQKSSIQLLLKNYVEGGGKIMLCPHCAQAVGLTDSMISSEANIAAGPDEVARLFLEADKVIDY